MQNQASGAESVFPGLLEIPRSMPLPQDLLNLLGERILRAYEPCAISLLKLCDLGRLEILATFHDGTESNKDWILNDIWAENSISNSLLTGNFNYIPDSEVQSHQHKSSRIRLVAPIQFRSVTSAALLFETKNNAIILRNLESDIHKVVTILASYIRIYELEKFLATDSQQKINGSSPSLTDRQITILRLLQIGKTTNQIAKHLGFSYSTIHQDVILAYRLLNVHTRAEAISKSLTLGLLKKI